MIEGPGCKTGVIVGVLETVEMWGKEMRKKGKRKEGDDYSKGFTNHKKKKSYNPQVATR